MRSNTGEIMVKQSDNEFIFVVRKIYDEMIQNTDDVKVEISDDAIKIFFKETCQKDKVYLCEHKKPWRRGGYHETTKCRYCAKNICKLCGVDDCCIRHIPFVIEKEASVIKIIGIPPEDIWIRAVYFSDCLRMNVVVEPQP